MSGISDPRSHVQSRTTADPDVIYVGYRSQGRAIVEKQSDQQQLTPERSLELANHSPSGFEWGYGGSGPAQLALALLLDYTDDEEVALAEYKAFKTEVVSQLECTGPDGFWRLTGREIDANLHEIVDDPVAPSVN
ncbi:hypothetical protein C463_14440 [Halorubrum californiense DSM 19288]|uniref:Uncharacterized protein n=1 Tax=Halorubrum californiense DSM 19288 TaxID=1227465 RepID=M0E165_9EURY|nr:MULTISPECIES: DUF6166 domain-containing protein [Halorubrum]ELZ40798.1 hypothetical protein C463_14440 [Halorubrum californiense DSM 19288]TKX72989.1 hypothetical protein EXE40_01555 [Halorubrum sp. GN11GM_10-3_MGM]